jgi:hypothetical protein
MPREVNSTLLLGYRWMEKCLLQKFELNKFCVLVINWQRAGIRNVLLPGCYYLMGQLGQISI